MRIKASFATALLISSAQAAAAGGYAGLGLGNAKADYGTEEIASFDDGSFISMSANNSDTAISLFVGAELTPNLAIEAAYTDLGETGISATSDGSGALLPPGTLDVSAELSAISMALKAQAPLNDSVSLHGKLGVARWNADYTGEFNGMTVVTGSESGTDPLIGLGVSFALSSSVRFGLEATRYMDVGSYDTDVIGATIAYRFQ